MKWQNMQKDERDIYRNKIMSKDPADNKYKKLGDLMVLDDDEELEASHTYSVRPVSRLAHLKHIRLMSFNRQTMMKINLMHSI